MGSTHVPQHGKIEGGALDGWRYAFLRFVNTGDPYLSVDVRATPPHWPFPMEVRMPPRSFRALRAVPGERARRLPVESLRDSILEVRS
jgi:hypothetical protein